jgi:hypothetical protein
VKAYFNIDFLFYPGTNVKKLTKYITVNVSMFVLTRLLVRTRDPVFEIEKKFAALLLNDTLVYISEL